MHGQLLLDVLNEVAALRVELAIARGSTPSAPPSDESWLPFGNMSQKGGVHRDRGRDFFLARLYLGDTHDMYFGYFGFDVFIFLMGCIC